MEAINIVLHFTVEFYGLFVLCIEVDISCNCCASVQACCNSLVPQNVQRQFLVAVKGLSNIQFNTVDIISTDAVRLHKMLV